MNVPTSPAGWLLLAALTALIVVSSRRSVWDGTTARLWWRGQRMHHRPTTIAVRQVRVVATAALLVSSVVTVMLLIGVLVTAAAVAGLLAFAWYRLRVAAAATEPHIYPAERVDVQLGPDDEDATGPLPRIQPTPPIDPHDPPALEV